MRKHHHIWAGGQRKDVLLLEPQSWDYPMAGRSMAVAVWSSWAPGGRSYPVEVTAAAGDAKEVKLYPGFSFHPAPLCLVNVLTG